MHLKDWILKLILLKVREFTLDVVVEFLVPFTLFQTQNSPNQYTPYLKGLPNGNKLLLNMEKKNVKEYLRKLGWAGVIFFTVKGTITLLFGAWLLQKMGCEP